MCSLLNDVETLESCQYPPFTYTLLPLGSVRLLTPIYSPDLKNISWRLNTVSLELPGLKFDALSYTWGSQAESFPIVCNEQLLYVHRNLNTALPYLARRAGNMAPLPIWIDAVCINQRNEVEKMAQLKLMNKVYRRAEMVWIWLGLAEHQDQIPSAIGLLPRIIKLGAYRDEHPDENPERATHEDLNLHGLTDLQWSAVLHIVGNDWFRRVWIVQEIALARTAVFLCGDNEIVPEVVFQTADAMATIGLIFDHQGSLVDLWSARAATGVHGIRQFVQHYMRGQRGQLETRYMLLQICVHVARIQLCLRPQDRVLGLLGLLEDDEHSRPYLNTLTRVQSHAELYTRFSTILLTETNVDDDLWYGYFELATELERSQHLPSWVPDLHRLHSQCFFNLSTRVYVQNRREMGTRHAYRASSGIGGPVRKGSQWNQILVQGKLVDEIKMVYPEAPPVPVDRIGDTRFTSDLRWFRHYINTAEWEDELSKIVLGKQTKDGIVTLLGNATRNPISVMSYWQTLHWVVEDAGHGEVAYEKYKEFRSYSRAFRETVAKYRSYHGYKADEPFSYPGALAEALDAFGTRDSAPRKTLENLKFLAGRQLFQTEKGYFGYTKKGVQRGDQVCLITGLPVFHVFREVIDADGGEQLWKLVGDAYLNGLMHGEADQMDIEERGFMLI